MPIENLSSTAEGWHDFGGRTYPKCPLCGGQTSRIKSPKVFARNLPNLSKCTHCGAISEGGEHGKIFDSRGYIVDAFGEEEDQRLLKEDKDIGN